VKVMVRCDKLIYSIAIGGALLFSSAAYSQQTEYNYFYPFEKVKGLYYAPGTPVLQADGPVSTAPPGTSTALGAPPVVSSPPGAPTEPLMTGRSVVVGTVGNHCSTPQTTCMLEHSSIQGKTCSCNVEGRWERGTVVP
jgi:hypothetical protein